MTEVTSWWWVRHAPVTVNNGRIYGNDNPPCDTSDREIFRRLASRLPHDAVWVSSHLQRTHQTAAAIAEHLPAEAAHPPHQVEELGEQSFGDWQGKTHAELAEARDGAWHRFWLAPAHQAAPGGEAFTDLMARVGGAIEQLSEEHRGRNIIAVTHGGTIMAALAHALGLEPDRALAFQIENCALTRMDHYPGAHGSHAPESTGFWRVGLVNATGRDFD